MGSGLAAGLACNLCLLAARVANVERGRRTEVGEPPTEVEVDVRALHRAVASQCCVPAVLCTCRYTTLG